MLSPKHRRNLYRLIPYGAIWFIFSIVYTVLEKGLVGDLDYYPGTGNPYNFRNAISTTPIAALLTGLVFGVLEILYIHKWFKQTSFGKKIFYKSAIYLAIISTFLILLVAVGSCIELEVAFFSRQVWSIVRAFLFTYTFLAIVLYVATTIVVLQSFVELSENVSTGVLQNFFVGKFHKPVEQERIFMFLDMKSSTTIAESIGHIRYFEMLREYYADLSDPIVDYYGEIYQYVGDEIVVSWTLKNGLRDSNCIRCFFEMKNVIKSQASKYIEKFGLVPEFKAGFHLGKVTAGEIGVIKREIIFTGDVLNTTARIQGLCNEYQVDILVSSDLIKRLGPDSPFQVQSLHEAKLRGRDERIELFTIVAGQ
jgi:adenylate cyclase